VTALLTVGLNSRAQVGRFGRRERKGVFGQIKALTVDIVEQLQEHTDAAVEAVFRPATWRPQ